MKSENYCHSLEHWTCLYCILDGPYFSNWWSECYLFWREASMTVDVGQCCSVDMFVAMVYCLYIIVVQMDVLSTTYVILMNLILFANPTTLGVSSSL